MKHVLIMGYLSLLKVENKDSESVYQSFATEGNSEHQMQIEFYVNCTKAVVCSNIPFELLIAFSL